MCAAAISLCVVGVGTETTEDEWNTPIFHFRGPTRTLHNNLSFICIFYIRYLDQKYTFLFVNWVVFGVKRRHPFSHSSHIIS
jgi:hypothetical protein